MLLLLTVTARIHHTVRTVRIVPVHTGVIIIRTHLIVQVAMDTGPLLGQGQQVHQQKVLERHLQAVRQGLQQQVLRALRALYLDYIQLHGIYLFPHLNLYNPIFFIIITK